MSLVVPLDELFAQESGLLARHSSWQRVQLGEVASVLNGFAFKSSLFSKSEGTRLIRIRDLENSTNKTFYTGDYSTEYLVKKGDLLIGMDGNFGCYEWTGEEALLNQRVCKIKPDENYLLKRFLFYGVNGYLKTIQDATSSVTVSHLSSRDILKIPFPLPPLNEQRRIVAKLEKLLAKVNSCGDRLDKIPTILKRFRQSVLAAACSGRLTADWREQHPDIEPAEELLNKDKREPENLPKGWYSVLVGSVISNIKYGTSKKSTYDSKGVPILRIPNISEEGINISNLKYAELNDREYKSLSLGLGDILLIRSNGSVSLVGKTAIVSESEVGFAYAGYLIRLRPNPKKIIPNYLNMLFSSYEVRLQIELPARSTSGVNNINSEEVKSITIPLPSLAEQKEIVRRVESLFQKCDQIEARYQKARAYTDKLTQAILAKAFRGELVPQDPNDEPAEVLLERIKAEKAATQPQKKPRQPRSKKGKAE